MTPTLFGRIQTRLFLIAIVGLPWSILIGPFLPRRDTASLGDVYQSVMAALFLVAFLGVFWEFVYHGVQQYRWDKDWPTVFGLLTGINEGLLVYVLMDMGNPSSAVENIFPAAFILHFLTTWILIWAVAQGPMQIVFLRWRYRGGRLV